MRIRIRIRNVMLIVAFTALLITIAIQQYRLRRLEAELQKANASRDAAYLRDYYRLRMLQANAAPNARN